MNGCDRKRTPQHKQKEKSDVNCLNTMRSYTTTQISTFCSQSNIFARIGFSYGVRGMCVTLRIGHENIGFLNVRTAAPLRERLAMRSARKSNTPKFSWRFSLRKCTLSNVRNRAREKGSVRTCEYGAVSFRNRNLKI